MNIQNAGYIKAEHIYTPGKDLWVIILVKFPQKKEDRKITSCLPILFIVLTPAR